MYVYAPTRGTRARVALHRTYNPRDGVFATGPYRLTRPSSSSMFASGEESQVSMVMTRVNRGFVKLATMIGRAQKP